MIIADDRTRLLDRGKSSDRSMKKITGKVRFLNSYAPEDEGLYDDY